MYPFGSGFTMGLVIIHMKLWLGVPVINPRSTLEKPFFDVRIFIRRTSGSSTWSIATYWKGCARNLVCLVDWHDIMWYQGPTEMVAKHSKQEQNRPQMMCEIWKKDRKSMNILSMWYWKCGEPTHHPRYVKAWMMWMCPRWTVCVDSECFFFLSLCQFQF